MLKDCRLSNRRPSLFENAGKRAGHRGWLIDLPLVPGVGRPALDDLRRDLRHS